MADADTKVAEFLRRVIEAMGLDLQVSVEPMPDHVRINLEGEGGELLLRRKGEALEALQQIVNTGFRRESGGGDRHFVIDCLGFRKARDAELRQMARYMMEKAKSTRTPQEMGPLNPYARRLVHLTVAEDPDLTSESIGDAFLKTVIISVKR
jgi:spoIIIJ-associated protein